MDSGENLFPREYETGSRDRGQPLEMFGDQVNSAFFPMECRTDLPVDTVFRGGVSSRRLRETVLSSVWGGPLEVTRNHSHIRSASEERYLIKFQIKGSGVIRHRGREAKLDVGDFTLCLSSEPYSLRFPDDFAQVVLAVPVATLRACVSDPERLLGVRASAADGINGLFTQFMVSICERAEVLEEPLLRRLESSVMDLMVAVALHHGAAVPTANRPIKEEYLHRLKRYIATHLYDPKLSPESIAAAHQITTRYLHMLFSDSDLSLCKYIQSQRLQRCHAVLSDKRSAHRTVSHIAFESGFNDASHFSRVFKAEFGESPARFRRAAKLRSED